MKTSMVFTISLSYLIFGGSSLLLIGNLIIGTVKTFLGAEIFVSSMLSPKNLPESTLRPFLEKQKNDPNGYIGNYAFRGPSLASFFDDAMDEDYNQYAMSGGNFPEVFVHLYPVEENYLDSSLVEYYMPRDTQSGVNYPKIDGKEDLVWSLYSNEGTVSFGGDLDKYDVLAQNLTGNPSFVVENPDPTEEIKIILPEGISEVLSINGGDTIKLFSENDAGSISNVFRLLVRGMPRKLPGFFFMSYRQVSFFLQGLISFPQAETIMKIHAKNSADKGFEHEKYLKDRDNIDNTFGIPKVRINIR